MFGTSQPTFTQIHSDEEDCSFLPPLLAPSVRPHPPNLRWPILAFVLPPFLSLHSPKISPPFIFPLPLSSFSPLPNHQLSINNRLYVANKAITTTHSLVPCSDSRTHSIHLNLFGLQTILINNPYPTLSMTRLATQMSIITPQGQQDTL